MNSLEPLQNAIGITFNDTRLLQQVFVHRSLLNEQPDFPLPSNERLEFLGDALLNFMVAEWLYQEFPHSSEGELTQLRAALVCKETLVSLAQYLGLGGLLCLGRGEELSGGRHRPAILASTFEALIGAVFLDQGFAPTKEFITRMMRGELDRIVEKRHLLDPKSRLQELVQSRRQLAPIYRLVQETGPEHNRSFVMEVLVEGNVLGKGIGKSKRQAEKEAAKAALESLIESPN